MSFFLVSGFGSGAYSAKLLAATRQRFSGFSQPRQCGDDVLRMLVTGGPPVFSGGGIPRRIKTISRSLPAFRATGDRAFKDEERGPWVHFRAASFLHRASPSKGCELCCMSYLQWRNRP
jgi:hypothetical protein